MATNATVTHPKPADDDDDDDDTLDDSRLESLVKSV
jgi:hypothetical protein